MLGKMDCTVESLKANVASRVSDGRFRHCLGVAQTIDKVLKHYSSPAVFETWNGVSVSDFCGIGHDIAREVPLDSVLDVCRSRGIIPTETQTINPVFAHGVLGASMLEELYGDVPANWLEAICKHTLGDRNLDDVGLALFVSDFIEPGRKYLTDADRERYLSEPTLRRCALAILRDNIKHEVGKGSRIFDESLRMLTWLEEDN